MKKIFVLLVGLMTVGGGSLHAKKPTESIWYAAAHGHAHQLQRNLRLYGADSADSAGDTALHHAAAGNHAHEIRILRGAGATINVRNRAGDTPLDVALKNRSNTAAQRLRGYGGKTAAQLRAQQPAVSSPLSPEETLEGQRRYRAR